MLRAFAVKTLAVLAGAIVLWVAPNMWGVLTRSGS
jgi:hypothetical protein